MLIADEHGFFARIAPTAAAALTIRICFVQFHKAAILRAVKLDVIIRRAYARNVRVVVAALMRDSQIVGIVGASDILAPILLTCTLDIVWCSARRLIILRLGRIAGSDVVRMSMPRLLKIGIRILRLHSPLHKGGKKRIRLSREDTPRLVRAALIGNVPAGVRIDLLRIINRTRSGTSLYCARNEYCFTC